MYTIPTLAELRDQFIAHYETESGQTASRLPVSWIYILGTVIAGIQLLLHRAIQWASRQVVPQTADEATLMYMADVRNVVRKQGTNTVLNITISGDPNTTIPAGTIWLINNISYQQNNSVIISADTVNATVTAMTIGTAGNAPNDTELTPSSPIAGVTGATVASMITEGTDAEKIDEFRDRIINKMRNPPQGGSATDYVTWALEVDGIKKAFAKRSTLGTVTVYPLRDITGDNRIPDATLLQAVADYVSDPQRRPLGATATAEASEEKIINVEISAVSPQDAFTKQNIEDAIRTYFFAAYPKQYDSELDATNVVNIGDLWEAVRSAGATAANVEMNIVGIGQATSYTLQIGEICKLGAITWV